MDLLPIIVAASVWAGILVILYVVTAFRTNEADRSLPLAVPKGSVRAILALLIVGGFVIFLFFGSVAMEEKIFDKILTAFAALAGSATGFYFGQRASG